MMGFKVSARRAMAAGCLALAAAGVQAQTQDWWVHLANDRVAQVRELLAQGVDPNARYANGQPALMHAVVDGAWNVFDLIAADPRTDLNIENPAGETPLMYLALAGQVERARRLVASGAHVNRLGWTPLHYAASKGQVDMAKFLLEQGAMPNAPSPNGVTPLMMAGYSKSRSMVELLIQAGADPLGRDEKGQSAADWAQAGKAHALAEEIRVFMARAESERTAAHSGGAPAAPQTPAPAMTVAPEPGGNKAPRAGVSGVSGLGLTNYDQDTSIEP